MSEVALPPKSDVAVLRTEQIFALEKILKEAPQSLERSDFMHSHHFAEGLYVRVIYLPKGTICTGEVHRFECVNIIAQGHVRTITTRQEEEVIEVYRDFAIFSGVAGTKRALIALEDTVWITAHPNPDNARDIAKLEEHFVVNNVEERI